MKLKGFTILELIIGMVLFGIITGLGTSAYLYVFKGYLDYKKTNSIVDNSISLNSLFNKDFSESSSVRKGNEGITCFFNGKESVHYKLDEDYIIRTQSQIQDTFKVPALEIKTMLNNELIIENSLIDGLSFTTQLFDKKVQLNFSKTYGADVLMELENRKESGDTY